MEKALTAKESEEQVRQWINLNKKPFRISQRELREKKSKQLWKEGKFSGKKNI